MNEKKTPKLVPLATLPGATVQFELPRCEPHVYLRSLVLTDQRTGATVTLTRDELLALVDQLATKCGIRPLGEREDEPKRRKRAPNWDRRCHGTTKQGALCRRSALEGDRCAAHRSAT